ncbi:putative homeodomain transcription factor isoform X2 [Bradysia coprophila]|uniref:putative homeodomain transcription factor isoform X2 n=1 Tax=Bradysia coprophila TaxID=38358 RepID=UPI00187DA0BA|nr:putative homeodomain transcription factor isoform X2 [Bradysia coprophila]
MKNLNQLVGWYQNNISKYDKNKWDSSVNNQTINAYGKYPKPNKQKPELIDVDTLVRGSSYTKAKTKQNLFTVIRLALIRFLLLPLYSQWWVQQTSRKIYNFLLTLYALQVFNFGMYIYVTSYCEENIVIVRDLMLPNLLSLLLSVIHSQIVATTDGRVKSSIDLQEKRRRLSRRNVKRKTSWRGSSTSSKASSAKFGADQGEPFNGNKFNVHRNSSTNCPPGLKKRNADWNHVYSPYRLNKNRLESNLELNLEVERMQNCEDTNAESERSEWSNIDHGFESFNGKSSSSDELGTTARTTSENKEEENQYLTVKPNVLLNGQRVQEDVDKNCYLSPTSGQTNTVFTSPWLGVTSNSECSYSSGSESDSMSDRSENNSFPLAHTFKPVNDKISCSLWRGNKLTKVEMSVLDISTSITNKVETMTKSSDYIYIGLMLSVLLTLVPVLCRICEAAFDSTTTEFTILDMPAILMEMIPKVTIINSAFGQTFSEKLFLSIGLLLRFCLTALLFFMLAVAERTFKERLLYAKLFSHLTSSRRARKSEVPHFRLSKLRNIKTWLSVRSYLKRRGPQRSVDVIVSTTLMLCLVFVSFLCAESLNDSVQQHWHYDLEVFIWSCSLGCFILRFMTLGTAINDKYRSVSILITEQINLYLKMEQNPVKKDSFAAANNVLKLAADLLKEIEVPFKISGFNINPYVSAGIRVLIVSALSGICSEILGFKLKLFKFKE